MNHVEAYLLDDKRYSSNLLSKADAELRISDLKNDIDWFKCSNDMYELEKAKECYKTISRLQKAIEISQNDYVKLYETKCIIGVFSADLLTPAQALDCINDMKIEILHLRWGAWRPDEGDWGKINFYEQNIIRLKKELTRYDAFTIEKECELD